MTTPSACSSPSSQFGIMLLFHLQVVKQLMSGGSTMNILLLADGKALDVTSDNPAHLKLVTFRELVSLAE